MIKKIEKILMDSEKSIKILDDSSPFLMVIKKINDEFETILTIAIKYVKI